MVLLIQMQVQKMILENMYRQFFNKMNKFFNPNFQKLHINCDGSYYQTIVLVEKQILFFQLCVPQNCEISCYYHLDTLVSMIGSKIQSRLNINYALKDPCFNIQSRSCFYDIQILLYNASIIIDLSIEQSRSYLQLHFYIQI